MFLDINNVNKYSLMLERVKVWYFLSKKFFNLFLIFNGLNPLNTNCLIIKTSQYYSLKR